MINTLALRCRDRYKSFDGTVLYYTIYNVVTIIYILCVQ